MRITIIGSGYVGLVSGACFAEFGHQVTCVDLSADKIAMLNRGEMPIYEPGLEELVAVNAGAGRLRFTTEVAESVAAADVVFIAVGTPTRRGEGHADLSYVYAAATSIASAVQGFTTIVTKSTVPVGTGDEVARIVRETNPSADVTVVSNPEFLREGSAIEDFMRPDRVVVGIEDERAREVMMQVYRPLSLNQAPIMVVRRRTAELIKYAANAFLAMKITFINEMADLCESVGADVQEVARGIGLDNRIGSKFLNAGPGYGGSCFPKDTVALIRTAQEHAVELRLVESTVAVNTERKHRMGRRVIEALGGDVRGRRIAVLGLAFKPNTDDMREAPSIDLIASLVGAGANVSAYDPVAMEAARPVIDGIEFAADEYAAVRDADCVVLVTEWNAFRSMDLGRVRSTMRRPLFVDLRNVYRKREMETAGFEYLSIGRP